MSIDPDEIESIQDEQLRIKLKLSSFEYETLEADLEKLKKLRSNVNIEIKKKIEHLKKERGE